jgi:hypothetical protein
MMAEHFRRPGSGVDGSPRLAVVHGLHPLLRSRLYPVHRVDSVWPRITRAGKAYYSNVVPLFRFTLRRSAAGSAGR